MLVCIIFCIFILFSVAVLHFFSIGFIRHDAKDLQDLDLDHDKYLYKFKDQIKSGIIFIKEHPHKWVYVNSFDGLKLAARYYNNNSDRTMILFHGYRSRADRDFSCAVKIYFEMGLNVLLVDQRSHGRSEGKLITFGVKEQRDVLTWTDFIINNYGKDTSIVLGGMSMGATTVLLSAGLDLPPNVKGIIADCGFTSPVEIIKSVSKKSFHINGTLILPIFDVLCRLFGNFSIYSVSTVESLKKAKVPVLLIHGLQDNFVPCEMSQLAYQNAICDKDICLVEKADHGQSYLFDTTGVTGKIEAFLTRIEQNVK